ncbi:hypothetical protein [Methanoplanus limicola]|uniref:Uncharacterized protein n=1 Tax=Methanoplanus limicola DSM 2279 TaxID=937775 RepID=H1YZS3_9EURY|nr:hypothetical protein [Methanoplanus limicola]EHQ34335.1 hypothetical protein Metlim_0182 [Methanoplanus limicola DSM 2279]
MKNDFRVLMVWIVLVIVGLTSAASAYTIDGDLSDWGLAELKTGDWSINDTWVPNEGIMYMVEDNHNPNHGGSTGVHIRGTGSTYTFYDEPYMTNCDTGLPESEPYGREHNDLEAMYFDQDAENFYVAIVTSVVPNGSGWLRPGDIALNLDNNAGTGDYGYEYGIRTREDAFQGQILKDPKWEDIGLLCPVGPDVISDGTGTYVGDADFIYTKTWLNKQDNGYDNYVIEICVSKALVNVTGQVSFSSLRVADNCLNDHVSYVPEFPEIAVSLALIVGSIFAVYMVQNRKNE